MAKHCTRVPNDELLSTLPGVITSIEPQKKANDRVSIFIDGKFALGLHADVLISGGLSKGQTVSKSDLAELIEADSYFRARTRAYHLLSYRQRSQVELSRRLSKSGFSPHIIDRIMERLIELDMIDDQAFARTFSEARVRSKGYGPVRLRSELYRKGIDSDTIDAVLADAYREKTAEVLALEAARKYMRRLTGETDAQKRRSKLTAYLARRGFSSDQMTEAVAELQRPDRKE
ncbi:MAG: RecX family transcriptional regulator [Rhodothermia bacterium]|nr:MAG: RecX family transcriptional regulator [Rhodothermia bacterium]